MQCVPRSPWTYSNAFGKNETICSLENLHHFHSHYYHPYSTFLLQSLELYQWQPTFLSGSIIQITLSAYIIQNIWNMSWKPSFGHLYIFFKNKNNVAKSKRHYDIGNETKVVFENSCGYKILAFRQHVTVEMEADSYLHLELRYFKRKSYKHIQEDAIGFNEKPIWKVWVCMPQTFLHQFFCSSSPFGLLTAFNGNLVGCFSPGGVIYLYIMKSFSYPFPYIKGTGHFSLDLLETSFPIPGI